MSSAAFIEPAPRVVEPDDLPFDEVLALCRHYLGEMLGVFSDWAPLEGRGWLFDESMAADDPEQFENFRVS